MSDATNVKKRMGRKNFEMSKDKIVAEPLQILLSFYGHPDAREKIRRLIIQSCETGKSLKEIIFEDKEIETYLKRFNGNQLEIISNPEKYVGIASGKTKKICDYWEGMIKDLEV